MSDMIIQWITTNMASMGYWGIGFLMFMENLFPPIPSELIMPLAGFTVSQGKMDFVPAVVAGVLGTILGAYPWYFAGKLIGEPRLRHWADRYGKWLTLSGRDIDKANLWFTRHGGLAVFLCRLVPGVRTLISLPAGINRMPLLPFTVYSTVGTAIWVGFLTWLGLILGANYALVEVWIGPIAKYIAIAIVVGFGLWVWQRRRIAKRRRRG